MGLQVAESNGAHEVQHEPLLRERQVDERHSPGDDILEGCDVRLAVAGGLSLAEFLVHGHDRGEVADCPRSLLLGDLEKQGRALFFAHVDVHVHVLTRRGVPNRGPGQ